MQLFSVLAAGCYTKISSCPPPQLFLPASGGQMHQGAAAASPDPLLVYLYSQLLYHDTTAP